MMGRWSKEVQEAIDEWKDRYFALLNKKKTEKLILELDLDENTTNNIKSFLHQQIESLIRNDDNLREIVIKEVLNFRPAFVSIFKPLVKELIEELNFNVSFKSEVRE